MAIKDYLGFENARNKQHAAAYTALIKAALHGQGEVAVLIGHHLTFEIGGDLATENEVPSADCLMFDHELMKRVFGDGAVPLMMRLAAYPVEARDELLTQELERIGVLERIEA